ncbi:MAG: 23S rRNA (pseudouridine(1915)-N(3))-methyltransferase RlmH [Ruminococcaceae bacterium]|nr:23S rRNA (pseudouridine(1915)-N(3))-methyltransferase RlmH [Oscillospiraceae bacterium]
MLCVKIISVGTLKEPYLRDAAAEYSKRLSSYCRLNMVQLKEVKLPDSPSQKEIAAALDDEAKMILSELSPRAYKIAMCVEGKQLSSETLAKKLDSISAEHSEICLVIGSSHGLSDKVKSACDMRLSVSELTFPHQLLRIMLLEAIYRAFNINAGTKYHK